MSQKILSFIIVIIICSVSASSILAQPNVKDAQGRKQGLWVQYKDGVKFYEGSFMDDKPQGEFRRFYKSGRIMSKSVYSELGSVCLAEFYYDDRKTTVKARGLYVNQIKDSLWLLYNEEGTLVSEENYTMGTPTGIWKLFNFNGSLVKETTYLQGKIHGAQKEFFEDGNPKRIMTFSEDSLQGSFQVFYPNKIQRVDGFFNKGSQEGEWKYYNEDGSLWFVENYIDGTLSKRLDAEGKPYEIPETVDTVKLDVDLVNPDEFKKP